MVRCFRTLSDLEDQCKEKSDDLFSCMIVVCPPSFSLIRSVLLLHHIANWVYPPLSISCSLLNLILSFLVPSSS